MKKKSVLFLILLLQTIFCFSQEYKIKKVNYELNGCDLKILGITQEYALEQNVPVNYKATFKSVEALEKYIADYKRQLINLRQFTVIEVNYSIENDTDVVINTKLVDAFHVIIIPYPKYDSNDGLSLKLKYKDTNFLGTLNSMTFDFIYKYKGELEDGLNSNKNLVGINFTYDYPFSLGIFDLTWLNEYQITYTLNSECPEWLAKTGFTVSLPFQKVKLNLDVLQYSYNDFDYKAYDDSLYFSEYGKFYMPLTLMTLPYFGNLTLTPYFQAVWNWDFNGINILNQSLSSPTLTIGQSLGFSRIDWIGYFKNGLSFTVSNILNYNIQRNDFNPFISAELKAYKLFNLFEGNAFNKIGITSDLYYFANIPLKNNKFLYTSQISTRMRGIRDDQPGSYVDSAVVLNVDLPFYLFSTNFNTHLMSYLNCDFTISPFMDVALIGKENSTKNDMGFNLKNGLYTAGVELLANPHKWSNFTVRISLGYDMTKTALLKNYVNQDWRGNAKAYEITFGVGLLY